MALMKHKAGTELQTGVTASPVDNTHAQSATRNAAGDLKIYHKTDGSELSIYVSDAHVEQSFEAVLEKDAKDHEIGDIVTVDSNNYVVTQWNVTETLDDVKKVSIGLRSTNLDEAK